MSESALWLSFQQGALVASGAFNALHFLTYRTRRRGRRLGALALALVNLSFLVQGLFLLALATEGRPRSVALGPGLPLVGLLTLAPSLSITLIILRRRRNVRP